MLGEMEVVSHQAFYFVIDFAWLLARFDFGFLYSWDVQVLVGLA